MPSRAREEEDSDRESRESVGARSGSGDSQEAFQIESVPLHCTGESENTMDKVLIRKAHHLSIYQKARYVRKKWSLYGDMQSH